MGKRFVSTFRGVPQWEGKGLLWAKRWFRRSFQRCTLEEGLRQGGKLAKVGWQAKPRESLGSAKNCTGEDAMCENARKRRIWGNRRPLIATERKNEEKEGPEERRRVISSKPL